MNAPLILWILALGTHCSAHFVGLPHLTQLIKIISFFGESSMNWVCQIREAYEIWRVVGVQDQSWNWFKQTVIFRTQNTFQQFNKALAMQLYSEWLRVIFFYKEIMIIIYFYSFIYLLAPQLPCLFWLLDPFFPITTLQTLDTLPSLLPPLPVHSSSSSLDLLSVCQSQKDSTWKSTLCQRAEVLISSWLRWGLSQSGQSLTLIELCSGSWCLPFFYCCSIRHYSQTTAPLTALTVPFRWSEQA